MVIAVLDSGVVDRGFEPPSGQAKYFFGISSLSTKHAALRGKSKR
jgi:hypothetical protein